MSDVKLSNKLYEESEECNKYIKYLIESDNFPEYKHLIYLKIKCLFKEKMEGYGWNKLGKVLKVNDLYWSLLDLDIIIVINQTVWDKINKDEKLTLVMHLLSKIKVYYKYEGKKKKSLMPPKNGEVANFDISYSGRINYTITPPDIEEFETVVNKVGEKNYEQLKKISLNLEE